MAWHYRKRNLLKELLTHKPDIMCLQVQQQPAAEQAPSEAVDLSRLPPKKRIVWVWRV